MKNNRRGDIALFLTLTSFALMVTGALVGSQLVKQGPRINPRAAGCIPITNVVTNPTTVSLGGTFECQVTVNSADAGSPTIACGLWGNSIYWPQNICPSSGSGFLGWSGNTARFRCTLPANANTNDNLRMIGFDFSTGCNDLSKGKTYTLNIAGQPPPTDQPSPPDQPPTPPAPPPTNCNSCTECIWNLRQDVVNAHDPNFWPRNTCADKDAIINDWCGGGMGQAAADDCNIEKAGACVTECAGGGVVPTSPPEPTSPPAPSTSPSPPPGGLRCYEDYSGTCPELTTCVNDTTYSVPAPSLSGCSTSSPPNTPIVCCVEKSRLEKKFTGSVTVNFSNKNSLYNGLNAVNAFLYSRTGPSAPWEIVRSHYPTNWTVKNPVFYPFGGIINGRSNRYDFTIYELPAYEYAIYSYARLTGGFPYVSGVVTNCPGGTIQDIIFTPNKFNACVFRGSAIPATGASAIFTIIVDQAPSPTGTGKISGNVKVIFANRNDFGKYVQVDYYYKKLDGKWTTIGGGSLITVPTNTSLKTLNYPYEIADITRKNTSYDGAISVRYEDAQNKWIVNKNYSVDNCDGQSTTIYANTGAGSSGNDPVKACVLKKGIANFTITIPAASSRPTWPPAPSPRFDLESLSNAAWEAMINDIASGIKDAIEASKFVSENFCHVPGLQKQTCDPTRGECQTFTPPCYSQDVGAI